MNPESTKSDIWMQFGNATIKLPISRTEHIEIGEDMGILAIRFYKTVGAPLAFFSLHYDPHGPIKTRSRLFETYEEIARRLIDDRH